MSSASEADTLTMLGVVGHLGANRVHNILEVLLFLHVGLRAGFKPTTNAILRTGAAALLISGSNMLSGAGETVCGNLGATHDTRFARLEVASVFGGHFLTVVKPCQRGLSGGWGIDVVVVRLAKTLLDRSLKVNETVMRVIKLKRISAVKPAVTAPVGRLNVRSGLHLSSNFFSGLLKVLLLISDGQGLSSDRGRWRTLATHCTLFMRLDETSFGGIDGFAGLEL